MWAASSVALHLAFVFAPRTPGPRQEEVRQAPATEWLESVAAPPAEPVAEAAPAPDPPVTAPEPERTRSNRARSRSPSPVAPPPMAAGDAAGGVAVSTTGEPGPENEPGALEGEGAATNASAPSIGPEPASRRTVGPAQLSMWLNPPALERLALQRPALTLLLATPGFRDVFRGSSIRPFIDLERLRVFLPGIRPDRLSIAGVHSGGERALHDAAQRVAAMRSLEVDWRGGSDLRATAWIDPSEIDRGLAVHGGAFLIGARANLPGILGTAEPGARVARLSKLRRGVIAIWVVEDASVYLPRLTECGLQALHVSVAAHGEDVRMSLIAHYASSTHAATAPECLGALANTKAPRLVGWLQTATGAAEGFSRQLRSSVGRDELERLFDEISAALRQAVRT